MPLILDSSLPAEMLKLLDRQWNLLIGGELRQARSGRTYQSISPYTEGSIAEVPNAGPDDVEEAVAAAEACRAEWRNTTALERAELVRALADEVEAHTEELAMLDSIDVGSPINNSRHDVQTAVTQLRMFAGLALEMKGVSIPATNALHVTVREPIGVVARIGAYNHPLMFACKIGSSLVAGNPTILKPAEVAPLSALRLGELAAAIFPAGVVSVIVGDGPMVPDALVRHPKVRRIGFIGSERTGRAIQRAAAESSVKDISLELGGKNAMVVFADADLEKAALGAVAGMNFTWSGQSCGSNSRLLLDSAIHDEVVGRMVKLVEARTIGDPLSEASEQGTMVNKAQYDKSLDYIQIAVNEGATIVTGGGRPAGLERGYFLSPTILTDVAPGSRIAQEEVFGPVMSVIRFSGEAEALEIANGVNYGLTASVWTSDLQRAHRVVREFEAGVTWINGSGEHFPGVPFGGRKGSGIGREESLEELLSYTEIKSINVMY